VIEKNLRVMDATAIALCREHNVPILVFNFKHDGNIVRASPAERSAPGSAATAA
jgi:uridylate kinase